MIAPAERAINHDLHVHTTIESELIFSIFLLAFIIGPLFLAPLSEVYGRMIILQLSNIVRIDQLPPLSLDTHGELTPEYSGFLFSHSSVGFQKMSAR